MIDMSELELIECDFVLQKLIRHYKYNGNYEHANSLELVRLDVKGELVERTGVNYV